MIVNQQIASVVKPDSPGARMAFGVRCKIYRKLQSLIDLEAMETILDVGVSPDQSDYSNFFELFYPHSERITALSDQDASALEERHKGLRFVRGDGRALPFPDGSFDLVFSSAVLEHTGEEALQLQFIRECLRVSRKYLFLTTPNRWHPFEFHTYWPLAHWLPKKFHRRLLKLAGLDYLAQEEHLNLLSAGDLNKFAGELGVTAKIHSVRFLGIKSNLLMLVQK